ncbi:excinuclease ABC subunit UvrC [Piscirickettsia litoralis]|uniref:UvrABC system protein C n=1 Tax=Piscirickettsia litoralis TaxID=1891921 RepID=A0ABX3A414_9GAMM|nr:excinuclease ABC subunit UvrC [Piscirickettsia litoralis]ODN42396.1 excinuclease ABC subunit C [Piscirickettsia litoralis]
MSFDAAVFLTTVPDLPGVYQMIDRQANVIYVGKAKSLKKRLGSYFQKNLSSVKTEHLVSQIAKVETIVTETEKEALLLECSLIKSLKPRYNILLRDDKSYPYLVLSAGNFPNLTYQRGGKRRAGEYFGPYPDAGSAKETLNLLQKTFKLRSCDEHTFKNRSRPCLQHQIGRCDAPCVGWVKEGDYQESVKHTRLFLQGKSQALIDQLVQSMEVASQSLAFEKAGQLRDQITHLRRTTQQQAVVFEQAKSVDVVVLLLDQGVLCIQVMMLRQGRLLGNKSIFSKLNLEFERHELLELFLVQWYLESARELPAEICIEQPLANKENIEAILTESRGHKVKIRQQGRGLTKKWLALAQHNGLQALKAHLAKNAHYQQGFIECFEILQLDERITQIECFDVSHTMGQATVASCVVFNGDGPLKKAYRRFNITGISAGDDYAALADSVARRYQKVSQQELDSRLLLIDGGRGQFNVTVETLAKLGLTANLLAISKGSSRRPGLEVLHLYGGEQRVLAADSPALHFLQKVRDEAHRFAIEGHRAKRGKMTSVLETIEGVGPKRRKTLLHSFGGLQELKQARVEEIAQIDGIGEALARRIVQALKEKV